MTDQSGRYATPSFRSRIHNIESYLGSPSARIDRHWLRRQQELLGDTRFDELLHSQLDEPSVANLKDYLSQAATDDQGVQQHLSQWDPLIADVVATIEGDEDAAARLPPLLDELGATSDWGALVAVLRRILAGERGEQLVVGLDAVGTAIAHETLWWVTNGPRAGNPRRAKAAEQQR